MHAPGPISRLIIAPGVLRLECVDLDRRYFTEQRARRRAEDPPEAEVDGELMLPLVFPLRGAEARAGRFLEDGWEAEGSGRGLILYWSRKSRVNMIRVLAELDYTPLVAPGRVPGIGTLTLPGDWQTVAPTGAEFKKLVYAFKRRWLRAWGESVMAPWKMEFQRRGAPHLHFATSIEPGARAGEMRMLGQRYRPAVGDGEYFRQWLSSTWADVVNHPDPVQRLNNERAGTNWEEDFSLRDPKRASVYFAKYSVTKDKEYQNMPPAEWRGQSVGRFWGYWGLERATATVILTLDEQVMLARTLRRHARARGVVSARNVPRGITPHGEQKFRKLRRRSAARLGSSAGFVTANDAPHLALDLARLVNNGGRQ
jgi:hypothetical protein